MWAYQRLIDFLGIRGLLNLVQQHQLTLPFLMTREGFSAFISPIFPALLILEMLFLVWLNRRSPRKLSGAYKIPILMYLANIIVAGLINLQVLAVTHDLFLRFALFQTTVRLRWFLYAYVVWELSHYVYHYSCHKVRILWCMHSPHHAPEHMNLFVIYTALFLQGTYATFVRTAICTVLGVPFTLLVLAMTIDGCWGALIHVSEEVWPKGSVGGPFGRIFLNPIHHRIHHSRNPEYIDKNYCNLLPIWDLAFGTLQHELPGVKPEYGLKRHVKKNSFMDMYFGDIVLLIKDVHRAPTLKQKVQHVFMPPDWQPAGKAEVAEQV
jgi:sterol desaturase/sphingolipid hydroxylase (fatty acid hydroxylase superfamily)